MRIESAQLRLLELPLRFRFETSFGVQRLRTIPLLTLRSQSLEGYAEGVMEVLPQYREETIAGALGLLDHLLPRLMEQDFATPEAVGTWLAPYRGNKMAKAMIEMAFWDLYAKALETPLWTLLGGTQQRIPVGVSLGIQSSIEATGDAVERLIAESYSRIKLKIKPGWDVHVIAGVRERFPDVVLTVDANSAYSLSDVQLLRALDDQGLDYIEQPLAYDDLIDHAALQQQLNTAICLDESIGSASDTRKALAIGAGRVINLKVARVGGHAEARRVHDQALSWGAPVWCGGMLEAGVGRAHNLHLSTLPNFTKPGDTSSASRYWHHDIVNEPLEMQDGCMTVPTGPGIGVTLNEEVISRHQTSSATYPRRAVPSGLPAVGVP